MSTLSALIEAEDDSPAGQLREASQEPMEQETASDKDPLEEILDEDNDEEIPQTPLGNAVDNLLLQWNQLLGHMTTSMGHGLPTGDHIKEVAEYSVRQIKDAMLEVSGELSRVSMEWRLSHPEDVTDEEVDDYKVAIARQDDLHERLQAKLKDYVSEFPTDEPH
ncbi:Protein F28F8.5 b [Aphelenchoides avenae]|nr:Protein F28F8.5 b [Aphelenchus avenae]